MSQLVEAERFWTEYFTADHNQSSGGLERLLYGRRRRKRDSKRRWIARFRIGRVIPALVIVEHDLEGRLKPAEYVSNLDAIRHCHAS
jgi:hypothetical protein